MIQCECPQCNYAYQVDDNYAGKAVKCPKCSERMVIPEGDLRPRDIQRKDDPLDFSGQGESFARRRAREINEEEGGGGGRGGVGPVVGWVIFFLIFGVGNLILYSTTGWLIIPIRR